MSMFAEFHFMRPDWLYALFPLLVLLWWLRQQRLPSRSWQRVVEPRLLAHLLIGQSSRQRSWVLLAVGLGGLLSIFAMAGPAWQKLEVPVFRQPSALVVLLDLSRSMDAADIKPSRLQRAKMKLRDILNQQKEGEIALIVYAATPFVVSPLTSDAKTIASQLESLSTDLMPAQGSRPDRAIRMAQQLLQQSGAGHGGVLLISDGIDGEESGALKGAIKDLVDAGHRLSVLGAGSPEGAPIPAANGGFLKDSNGAIVLPRLDDAGLATLARQGNGSYRRISTDDSDFDAVLAPLKNSLAQQQSKKAEGINSDQWRDEGPWLLLPLLLLGALAFRRGYLLAVLLLVLPLPRPAYALDWQSLWQRDDQRGQQAMQANNPKQAAQLFKNPQWRAAANYRAGNYQAAAQDLQHIDSADANYNRGNALAQQARLPEAVSAYEEALKRDPKNEDAKFNRDLVGKMLRQQSQKDQIRQDPSMQKQQQNGQGKDQQNKSDDKNGQALSPQAESGQSGAGHAQQDGKEDQQKSAKQDGKRGDRARETDQQKSANDLAAEQQAKQIQQKQQLTEAKNHGGDNSSEPQSTVDAQQDSGKMQQADRQWLRRIPDDPGGLWRRKFLYQYKQQPEKSEEKAW